MGDSQSSGRDPLQLWNEFIKNAVGRWPAGPSESTAQGQGGKDDPWTGFIDQLWRANPYRNALFIDPVEVARTFQLVWLDAVTNPERAVSYYTDFVQRYTQLMSTTARRLAGRGDGLPPVAVPEKGDRRFSAPDWQQSAIFDSIKQSYLLAASTLLKSAAEIKGLDERQHRKLQFYLRQFIDAISPSNFPFTNPEVIHQAVATGGQSLAKGMQNLLRDIAEGEIKLTDTTAFAPGRNLTLTPGQVVYRNKLMELIQYTPQTEQVAAYPLVFVPNWINKYYILDMQPENSMIRYLVQQGFTVFVVSWKNPDASMEEVTFEDYMDLGPLTAFQVAKEITGSRKVNAVGYCIGGTLLAMTLSYMAAKRDESVNSATFFVSLLDFSDVGDTAVFVEEPNIAFVEAEMAKRGYLDSRQMALMFNLLRANDLIWSSVVNNYLLGKDPAAFDLLYWNNDGTRMTRAAHSFYLRNTYVENNLIKPGKVVMKGVPIDLKRIRQDIYAVGTEQDHLVPWRTAWRISQLTGGKTRFVVGASGHIAGVINPPSKGRGYWVNDNAAATADEWFEGAQRNSGSWWGDWTEWLNKRSGRKVAPPATGGGKYEPLAPAPGTYLLEK